MSEFVIKPHRPWRWLITVIVLGVLFALSALLFTDSNDWSGIHQRIIGVWDYESRDLHGENAELREKVLMLEQTTRLDKQAAILLQEELMTSQEEIYQLKKDLEFYQGIMNTTGAGSGPDVHGIRIKPLAHAHGYRLELILLNIANTDKMIEGVIDVVLEGILDSTVKRLSLSDLSLDGNRIYSIRFRNFQRFENNFILPENFEPQRVFITLSRDDQEESGFEKVFDWPITEDRETADVG